MRSTAKREREPGGRPDIGREIGTAGERLGPVHGPSLVRPRCFGTSRLYYCLDTACPWRPACERRVSPWQP